MKMRLREGNHIRLFGGYYMEPRWLRDRKEYRATILRFIDNKNTWGSRGDGDLSAVIEFDQPIEFDGIKGEYGILFLRWLNQKWKTKGVAHVHLLSSDITTIEEMTESNARWMESHASYERTGIIFFVWSGLGFLVAVIGFAALLFTEIISEKITGDDQFYQEHGWVILIGMLIAAVLTFGLHRLLLLQNGRVVLDKETGQEVTRRSNHSLFFIPVRWWPIVFVVLGVILAFTGGPR